MYVKRRSQKSKYSPIVVPFVKPVLRVDRQTLKDKVRIGMVMMLAELGTCRRRKVGAILVDKRNRVLSEGYNGSPPGEPHCLDTPCAGVNCPSGTGLELCDAIHAEQNALKECTRPDDVHTVYCTDSPCVTCVKQLAGTGAMRIVFAREYPHSEAKERWLRKPGREWIHLPVENI